MKTCKVSCIDLRGVEHAAEVTAGSLYEAVAQALRIFRDYEWVEDIGHGQTQISVKVKHRIEHTVHFLGVGCGDGSGYRIYLAYLFLHVFVIVLLQFLIGLARRQQFRTGGHVLGYCPDHV